MTNSTPTEGAPPKQPIPQDFFASIHHQDPQLDLNYSLHRAKLQAALNIPANNRWVADWLFRDLQNPFHRNIAVPPEAFDNALTMDIMHHFFDVDAPACPFVRMRVRTPPPSPTSRFHTKGADMLLLPVASANGVTVGYSFSGVRHNNPSQSLTDVFCGRFAFETAREELLVINQGDQPGVPDFADRVMVIMSFMWTPNAVREHYMILCPQRDYTYYNLPNEVVFFSTAEMHTPSKRPLPMDILALQSLFSNNDSPDIFDELLQASPTTEYSPESSAPSREDIADLLQLPSATSDLPWFLDSSGKPQDNVGIPRRPGGISTSSGAFNMDALSESLLIIEESLVGDFYGSRQGLDLVNPLSAAHPIKNYHGLTSARNVVARISRSDKSQSEILRQFAVRTYLNCVLPVVSDGRFLTHMTQFEQRGAPPVLNPAPIHLQLAPGTRARSIAPLPIVSSSCESEGNNGAADEEERRKEEKREAKRRRNRLSAARSNEKRRESWRMQQRTLESLQRRVQELQGRKISLVAENQLLKERLTAGSE